MNMQEPYEEGIATRGFWARMKDRVLGVDDLDEEVADEVRPRRRGAIRLETARQLCTSIRHPAVYNDARAVADGLKDGRQQVVNLDRADDQMAERILDFLSGVTYALDGSVERVGDRVYLFAPANVQVEVDNGADVR